MATVGNAVPGVPNEVKPTRIGEIVIDAWRKMSTLEVNIKTDCFCLMPNHIHGIIIIENQPYTPSEAERRGRRSLQSVVHGFKSVTTRQFNKISANAEKNALWQSSFYDEIIRDDEMLYKIREYIECNPLKWYEDKLYTE